MRAAVVLIGFWFALALPAYPQATSNGNDTVRIGADQMHQLSVAKVENYPFRAQKSAVGQIAFNEDTSTQVLTPFSGRVTRLIAKVGDKVKRGDPLFEIDSSEVVQPQNDLIAAAAAANKAGTQLAMAQIAEKRHRELYEGKAGALKEWQQAQADLLDAENDARASATALDAVRNRLLILGFTQTEISGLEQKGTIRRTATVSAPIDGTVIARRVGPGQYVRNDPGEPLYTIADLSTVWLKAYVPESDISLVQIGQEAEVRVAAMPGRIYKARITMIGASTDISTRRIVVRSEIPNPDGALKAEMFANFKIVTGPAEPAPGVPTEAVIRQGDLASVWVQQQPGLFRRRSVSLGMEQDGRLQIRDGLKLGELVVARGAIFVENEWRQ